MHESRRSETKQEAGRAALLPPALTSPHGARQLYLGTATVCGAAAPLGHGAECRFSRQQTTTAPSKPLEAAAPRPAHRCFDSHSPATTALDSPVAAVPPRAGHPARISAGEGEREGAGKGSPAPHRSSSLQSPLASLGTVRPASPRGSPRGAGGRPTVRKQKQCREGHSPQGHPAPAPGTSPRPKLPQLVDGKREQDGRSPTSGLGDPHVASPGGAGRTRLCSRPTSPASRTRPPARGPQSHTKAEPRPRSGEGKRGAVKRSAFSQPVPPEPHRSLQRKHTSSSSTAATTTTTTGTYEKMVAEKSPTADERHRQGRRSGEGAEPQQNTACE